MNLNDPDRARAELDRAVESGDAEAIARVAMANIWPLVTAHTDVVVSAVSSLPATLIERHPILRLVHPMTAVMARTTRPFKPLVYAEDVRALAPEEVDFLILTQIIAFRASGDIASSLQYAKRLEERIQHVRIEARDRLDGPLWYFHYQIGSTLLVAGDSRRALSELATARQLGRLSAQPDAERVALSRVALAHAVRGALGDAEKALTEARGLPHPTPAHVTASVSTEHAAAALIAADRVADDLDDLLARLAPHDTTDLTWPFVLLARARAFLARQQPEDALEAIRLARDTHPVQQGSFASDVIGATSIEALVETGSFVLARRVAEEYAEAGVLTRIATVRLWLRDGASEAADRELLLLARDQDLGPAQRAECVLLGGWMEFARTQDVDRDTAGQIHRVARRPEFRRLISVMPRQLVEHVRTRLPDHLIAEFDLSTAGRVHVEIGAKPVLTDSELRVLNALVGNASTAVIASTFHVSPNTIKSQLRSLYRKLDCSTREEALRSATRLRLLSPEARP